ncbi:unnamed protein product, partial [marine sediment metagenome]
MEKVNAIVLAGTPNRRNKLIDEYDGQGPKNKALVTQITGKPLILGVLDCIRNSNYINQENLTIIGPRPKLRQIINDDNILILPEKKRLIDNVKTAYDEISMDGERTLFLTCDMPYLNEKTPKAIDDFVKECNKYNANFYLGIINVKHIPKEIEDLKKPIPRHLKNKGDYRTINMHLFEGSKIENRGLLENQIEKVFEKRRTVSFWTKVKFGASLSKFWWQIIKYCTIGLTKEDIESAVKKKFGLPFKLIET